MPSDVSTPSAAFRQVAVPKPKRLHKGCDRWAWAMKGRLRRRKVDERDLAARADRVMALRATLGELSDKQLRESVAEVSASARVGFDRKQEERGLALVAEVAKRKLGLDPYREQVMGAFALRQGNLAEMGTGEGKTLTIGLAATLEGWSGRPVHVVTANDYLAGRDAAELRPFYRACGLSVGAITAEMEPDGRRLHYARSITYGTSKEIVADFLKDRLALGATDKSGNQAITSLLEASREEVKSPETEPVMRGLHCAIVDEADHILVDEAVTPLLISQPRENELLASAVEAATVAIDGWIEGQEYTVDLKRKEVEFTARGQKLLEEVSPEACLMFRNRRWKSELVRQAMRARGLHVRGKDYIIEEGKIVIIDEATGRPAPMRTWRQGLHQAIEAKENLRLTEPTDNLASLSFQRFFRLYPRLAGISGTVAENAAELWRIYHLPVVIVPPHKPCQRITEPSHFARSNAEKWAVVMADVREKHEQGRPVLIGCGSVRASEELARELEKAGFYYSLLNASQLAREADIVAEAGRPGCITVATNMAGRGTDIRLREGVAEAGGLYVISTERGNSPRIERQLFGRCARQGDPGSVRRFASLDDDLARRFMPKTLLWCARKNVLGAGGLIGKLGLAWAQKRASGVAYRQRVGVMKQDQWLLKNLPISSGSADDQIKES